VEAGMKDLKTKERFVELRAQGLSFDSIAKELAVSKTTLLKWSRDLEDKINNENYFAYQRLIEQYKMTKIARLKLKMQEWQKVSDALEKKDFNELSAKELLNIQEKLENQLTDMISKVEYRTGETMNVSWDDAFRLNGEKEITIKLE
jgi:SMC interacting uncharacterized protein involved in chromosome segregation